MKFPSKSFRYATPEFAEHSRDASSVLMIDIGSLGDLIHGLPAMWAIRQSYPTARLHCVARGEVAGVLRLAPWIDHVWPYFNRKRSIYSHDLKMARTIRSQGYEVSINMRGNNRSCIIGSISGARHRLGRRPPQDDRDGWRWLNTHVMEQPYTDEPMYLQKWKCVAQAGLVTPEPEFHIADPSAARRSLGITPEDDGSYLHFSPFTSVYQKELPLEQSAALLIDLNREFPAHRLVLSCAPNAREHALLAQLLAQLPFTPWKVFDGALDEVQLASVVQGAALQFCGDTGSLHLAWLTQTPSVSWIASDGNMAAWRPPHARHQFSFAAAQPEDYLRGIDNRATVLAAHKLIDVRG